MNKIKVFKMINGEEIISEVFNEYADFYELKNPASIMLQPTQSGAMGVGIAPYMPYVTGNCNLRKTAIAAEGEPEQKMTNEYNRIFGSGIEVVPAGAIAGLK
jgi:hypothetical protein